MAIYNYGIGGNEVKVDANITPADATRVDRPYYCEPMRVRPNHKKHILRQGK